MDLGIGGGIDEALHRKRHAPKTSAKNVLTPSFAMSGANYAAKAAIAA